MKPSFATQNAQLADHSTLVVTGAGGRPKRTIWQHVQIDEGPEDEGCSARHCEDVIYGIEFLIEYYEYSFDYIITITKQFTNNAHT